MFQWLLSALLVHLVWAMAVRHDRGLYALACEEEANDHYGTTSTSFWLMRCYLRGVLGR